MKKKKNKNIIFISGVLAVFLILVSLGLIILKNMTSSDNLKEINLTFTGVNGNGKATLNMDELDKHRLKKIVDKKEFRYSIKPNRNLNNGDEVVLYIKNDGIFGNNHKYIYKVKGLKKNKDNIINVIDSELDKKTDVSEISTQLKKANNKKKIENKVINEVDKSDSEKTKINIVNSYLCKDKNKNSYHIIVVCELNKGDSCSYKIVKVDNFIKKNKLDLNNMKIDEKQILDKKDINSVNKDIKNKYDRVYLI